MSLFIYIEIYKYKQENLSVLVLSSILLSAAFVPISFDPYKQKNMSTYLIFYMDR